MKKLTAIFLAMMLMLTVCTAYAADIKPLPGLDMEDSLDDCILHIGFDLKRVDETEIFADIYDEVRYDAVDAAQLAVGDVISYMGEDVVVETVEEDYSILINGGSLEGNGITLCPDEGGTYIALNGEVPAYHFLGCAQLIFADEVSFTHWKEEEGGSISDELDVKVVSAAEIKKLLENEGYEDFYPSEITVRTEGGKVVELNVNHTP